MIIRIILYLLLLGGLTHCSKPLVQPIPIPQKFPSSSKAYKPVANISDNAWWQQLHDPELNQLVDLALRNNNDIHIALANLEQAQGELKQVKLSWIPTIKLYGGYSTNPALGVPGGFYGVWPYYMVNIMQLYSQQKQARYYVDYYNEAVSAMRLTVIGQITASYLTLMAQQEQLRLMNQFHNDLKELVRLSKQDITIGLTNEIDLAQLQSEEQVIWAQIKPIENNIVSSQNALRYLINADPGPIKNKNNFSQLDLAVFKPGSVPTQVLINRPDMKMAEYALKAAKLDITLAYSNFFPLLQLDEFIGRAHLPHSVFAQTTDAYANPNISLSTLGAISVSKGAYNAKAAEFTKTVRRILKEVDTDYSANKWMTEQFLTYQKAEHDYRHKYKLQQGLMKTGLLSYKELVQSKLFLDNLALSANQAKLELAMSLVVLYQDLASGYAYREPLG